MRTTLYIIHVHVPSQTENRVRHRKLTEKWYGVLLAILATGFLTLVILRQLLQDLPNIDTLQDYTPPLITRIYDRRNQIVAELFTERRTLIPLAQIPVHLQNAFLAVEDEDFFNHWGINFKGIARATVANLRHGRVVEGGSTITQQLSKVLFLTQERTLARKLRELLLALQLERRFSKEEIFQLYLNQIYFGHGAYGVEAASRLYLGRHVQELTLAECALLAGLPRSPATYSPFHHPDRAKRRRATVLARMREAGFINSQAEAEANRYPLVTQRTPLASPVAPYFVEFLRQQLAPKYGDEAIYTAGFSIYTTLDFGIQKAAEESMAKGLAEFEAEKAKEDVKIKKKPLEGILSSTTTAKVQGALIALDPKTGSILAMVGGRDFRESQFNRAVQAQRQPGSAFKPFVWTTALEHDLTPASRVDDAPIAFYNDGRDWRLLESATDWYQIAIATAAFPADQVWVPGNWDDKYFGPVTLRKGLAMSRNLVSIRLTDHLGPQTIVETAHRCGIQSPLHPVLSLALGTEQVNLLELTSAFTVFINGGIRAAPFGIQRIEDQYGQLLEEHRPSEVAVLPPQTAYLMTDLMKAVVNEGTGRRARGLGRPVIGKTGTNQELRDLWFVGETPDLTAGAWMGYDDFSSMGKHFTSATSVVPWWTQFMRAAHKGLPPRDFPVPEGITFAKIDAQTGYLALPTCPKVVLQSFKKGAEPSDFCPVDHLAHPIAELETEE